MMLEVNAVSTFHGNIRALWDVSLRVDEKEIVALVGANGAGKTTMLNTISGLIHPTSGSMQFCGLRIDRMLSYQIVKIGISHIPEGGKPFPDMTVRENLDMGAYSVATWRNREEMLEQVYKMFPILKERERQLARTLSGGERQMLAIGRGLMSRPRLCALDEPSYGLAPLLVKEIFNVTKTLRDQGMTVLLVEQNVQQTLEIADRAYVLENGRIVSEGKSGNLIKSDYVRKAYLGL
jgi:branched-chain amino acid transport system ATP-binding protein